MIIQITGVAEDRVNLMKCEGFITSAILADTEEHLYIVILDDSVILKAGYNITLDKGGKLFTLYKTEFGEVTIV